MSAAEESKQKKAFGIGWEFVKEYYTIMHHEPQSLYKFYGNDSFFCYGFEGESTQYCNGKEVNFILIYNKYFLFFIYIFYFIYIYIYIYIYIFFFFLKKFITCILLKC